MKTLFSACAIFALCSLVCAIELPDSHKRSLKEFVQVFSNMESEQELENAFEVELSKRSKSVVLKDNVGFSWNDCGDSSYASKVDKIDISPDPMRLPGNVNISFSGKLNIPIKAPLQLKLDVQKKVVVWIPVPCISHIGSCTYDDMCEIIEQFDCPAPFQKYGIPCECPVKEGTYTLPASAFYIDDSKIPSGLADGHYRVTAHVKQGDKNIACVHVEFAIAKALRSKSRTSNNYKFIPSTL